MKTGYELIEANGLTLHGDIEHFAEVVRADEREKLLAGVEMPEPVGEVRNSSVYFYNGMYTDKTDLADGTKLYAEAIRARGNT